MDKGRKVQYLTKLLVEASSGRDIRQAIPELLQSSFGHTVDEAVVKKLTYDVCKTSYLSEAECELLISGLKVDLKSPSPELVKISLQFLPSLPGSQLARMLEIGDLFQYVEVLLSHDAAVVRTAGVSSLAAILLVEDVLAAASTSVEIANTFTCLWESLSDCLLDEDSTVSSAAAAAIAKLMQAASSASGQLPAGFLLQRVGSLTGGRIITALGPVLGACQGVHSTGGQAHVALMLRLVAESALKPRGIGTARAPLNSSDLGTPGLVTILESLCSYWSSISLNVDAGTKLEACRSVLHIVALIHGNDDVSSDDAFSVGHLALPTSTWAAEAVATLLDLEDMQLMEAGITQVVDLIARHLRLLPHEVQPAVLRRLWAVTEKVQDVPCRMEAYALTWHAVVEAEVQGRHAADRRTAVLSLTAEAPGLKLSSALNDPYLSNVMRGAMYAPIAPTATPHTDTHHIVPTPTLSKAPSSRAAPFTPALPTAPTNTTASAQAPVDPLVGLVVAVPTPSPAVVPVAPATVDPAASTLAPPHEKKKGGGLFSSLTKMVKGKDKDSTTTAVAAAAAAAAAASTTVPPAVSAANAASAAASATTSKGGSATPTPTPAPPRPPPQLMVSNELQHAPGVPSPMQIAAKLVNRIEAPRSAPSPPPKLSSLRHEIVISLLEVVLRQPTAGAALQMCQTVQMADMQRVALDAGNAGTLTEGEEGVVQWVGLAKSVLQATSSCISWEPLITPVIATEVSAAAAAHAAADFSSAPSDTWLQLLQAACHTARSAQAILRVQLAQQQQMSGVWGNACGASEEADGTHLYGLAAPTSVASVVPVNAMIKQLTVLLADVDQSARELQQMMLVLIKEWPTLGRAVRPRLAWLLSHYLMLPCFSDASWDALLRCLSDLLVRGGASLGGSAAALRLTELMSAASDGLLYKSSRTQSAKDKPFLFDIVAASALCESPDYETEAPVVALACMQSLALVLQNHLAAATNRAATGSRHQRDSTSGSTDVKHMHDEASLVAARMESILREFLLHSEASSSPHLREWAKRVSRALSTITAYKPPEDEPPATDDVPAEANSDSEDNGAKPDDTPTHMFGVHDQAAPPDSSSDASSEYVLGAGDMPVFMPPSMYPIKREAPPPSEPQPFQQFETLPEGTAEEGKDSSSVPTAELASASGHFAATQAAAARVAAPPIGGVPLPSPYFLESTVVDMLWGYPFAGPKSSVLFHSKRSRRHRALTKHVEGALLTVAAGEEAASASASSLESGPLLSSNTMYCLDSRTFWDMLPGHPEHWQDLTGPGDPVLLCGSYYLDQQEDRSTLRIKLQATNRMQSDLTGVEVQVKTSGAILAERRGIQWCIPSLAPGDRAVHSFNAKVLGFSNMDIQCKLLMCPAMVGGEATLLELHCHPLHLSMASLICRPLDATSPPAPKFFKEWSALPSRVDLPATCVWPGVEGQALALSGALHQPGLACVMLQYLPPSSSFQAALRGETSTGDSVLIMLMCQLLPPSSPTSPLTSLCQVMVRSSSPEVVQAVQSYPQQWLSDLTHGSLLPGVGTCMNVPQLSSVPKPPVHPRLVECQQRYRQSCQAVTKTDGGTSFVVPNVDGSVGSTIDEVGGLPMVAGPRVGQRWLRGAAMAEWRRLVAAR